MNKEKLNDLGVNATALAAAMPIIEQSKGFATRSTPYAKAGDIVALVAEKDVVSMKDPAAPKVYSEQSLICLKTGRKLRGLLSGRGGDVFVVVDSKTSFYESNGVQKASTEYQLIGNLFEEESAPAVETPAPIEKTKVFVDSEGYAVESETSLVRLKGSNNKPYKPTLTDTIEIVKVG